MSRVAKGRQPLEFAFIAVRKEAVDAHPVGPAKFLCEGRKTQPEKITAKQEPKIALLMDEMIEFTEHDDVGLANGFVQIGERAQGDRVPIRVVFETNRRSRDMRSDALERRRHENRSQAAWREIPSASPMTAQLTSRSRSTSIERCNCVPACSQTFCWGLSNAMMRSVGRLSIQRNWAGGAPGSAGGLASSSAMILTQSATQASQMKIAGPAISFFTSCWDFPQNEQCSAECFFWEAADTASPVMASLTVRLSLTKNVKSFLTARCGMFFANRHGAVR